MSILWNFGKKILRKNILCAVTILPPAFQFHFLIFILQWDPVKSLPICPPMNFFIKQCLTKVEVFFFFTEPTEREFGQTPGERRGDVLWSKQRTRPSLVTEQQCTVNSSADISHSYCIGKNKTSELSYMKVLMRFQIIIMLKKQESLLSDKRCLITLTSPIRQ